MANVLVTGGAGFIGSHLSGACVSAGDQVTVVDNLSTGQRQNLSSDVRFSEGDLADPDFTSRLIEDSQPEIIYHLAAQSSVIRSNANPPEDQKANSHGTLLLLEAAGGMKNPPRFVYASTGGASYGDPESLPVSEDHPAECRSFYAASKHLGETYVSLYARLHGLRSVSLRLANIYGPRQRGDLEAGVVSIFAECIMEGRPVTLFGEGKAARDYVYVADAVEALRLAGERIEDGSVFNVGTGIATEVQDVLRLISKTLRREPARVERAPLRPGEVFRISLDPRRIEAATGWKSRFSLEAGIQAFTEWFLEK